MARHLRQAVALGSSHAGELVRLEAEHRQAASAAQRATQQAEAAGAALTEDADRIRDRLFAAWDDDRGAARAAARLVLDGPGCWGLRRGRVAWAGEQLAGWADRWRTFLPELPTDVEQLARVADRFDDRPALWRSFDTLARRTAEQQHPEHSALHAAAEVACRASEQARLALTDAHRRCGERLDPLGPLAWTPDPAGRLADVERHVASARRQLASARARVADLQADPVFLGQLPDRLTAAREAWRDRYDVEQHQRRPVRPGPAVSSAGVPRPQSERRRPSVPGGAAPGLGR